MLAGEWVPAGVFFGLAFLVAAAGVIGLGWWVLHGDALVRKGEVPEEAEAAESPHSTH